MEREKGRQNAREGERGRERERGGKRERATILFSSSQEMHQLSPLHVSVSDWLFA